MKSLARLASCVAVVGGLSLVPIYGAIWLARPDPSLKAEARLAPLPPRIAESIERKKDAPLRVEPIEVKPLEPMTEATVALTPPPASKPTVRAVQPHKAKIKHVSNSNVGPREIALEAAALPQPVVVTARNDAPY
jgi:hypothetical protein